MDEMKVRETDSRDTIVELDRILQRASSTYDTATIRRLITDDFTLITSSGRVMNGEDLVADVDDRSITWLENLTESPEVRIYNGDCAVITAILHSVYVQNGTQHDVRVRFTDTWVAIDGNWHYAAGHASRMQ
jgi:ketosteroid isomerase-like protein